MGLASSLPVLRAQQRQSVRKTLSSHLRSPSSPAIRHFATGRLLCRRPVYQDPAFLSTAPVIARGRSEIAAMKVSPIVASKSPIKFRLPTSENLVPIRLDIEVDGQRLKDAFTWNPSDPDSEVGVFARRTVKDLKLPPAFVTHIVQSVQSQLAEFRSFEAQDMHSGEKIVPIKLDLRVNRTVIRDQFLWDLNNFESDPEEFARNLCQDLNISDPEVGPAIATAIREQLYEITIQNLALSRETRVAKKSHRGSEYFTASKTSGSAVDIVKLFGNKASVIRKRKEWEVYEPIIDILSAEEAEILDQREEVNARLKRRMDDKDERHATKFARV